MRELEHEHADVDPDERERDVRAVCARATVTQCAQPVAGRRRLPAGARVIRAADPDRAVRHAVRADPATAVRARHVRLPVGMAVAAKRLGHGGLAYPRARRRRVHSGRGRSGPDRRRHRRHPGDVDDLPGARRGLRAGVLRGRGGGGSCAARRRSERASSAGERHAVRIPGFDLGNSPREYVEPVGADARSSRRRTGRARSWPPRSAASASSSPRC